MSQTRFQKIKDLHESYGKSQKLIDKGIKNIQDKMESLDETQSGFIKQYLFLENQKSLLNNMKRDLQYAMDWMRTGYAPDGKGI